MVSDGYSHVWPRLTSRSVDVPMSRVKFNINTEYAYIQNMKILQSTSTVFLTSLKHFNAWSKDASAQEKDREDAVKITA